MIAAAASKMPLNWFDVAVVFVLGFGYWRGQKNGVSKEILPLFYWLMTVVAAGFGYSMLGDFFVQKGLIKNVLGNSGFKERTVAFITAYVLIVVVVRVAYSYVKKVLKSRIEAANLFRASEYYLGMVAGVLRFACIIIFCLAFLNAPYFTPQEIAAERIYNNRVYGGGVQGYSGNFIPSLSEVQALVFKDSLLGPIIKRGLRVLLINTEVAAPRARQSGMEIY